MTSFYTFFAMGGYAEFVWPAYALTAAVMIGLLVISVSALRSDRKILESLQRQVRPRRGQTSDQETPDQGTPNAGISSADITIADTTIADIANGGDREA